MDLQDAAKMLGVDYDKELDKIADDPGGRRGVELAIMFRDHPNGGAELLVDLIHQVGEELGFNVREDMAEVIPNLDWWLEVPVITDDIVVQASV